MYSIPQVMIVAAFTLTISVLFFYSFYRSVVQQNEDFRQFVWDHAQLLTYYLTLILIVIYNANRVTNEVNWPSCEFLNCESKWHIQSYQFICFYTQGKRTAHIAYDQINCCNDRDVSISVFQFEKINLYFCLVILSPSRFEF